MIGKRAAVRAGRQSTSRLLVRDLMTEKVFALGPDDYLHTLRDLMDEKDIRHVPVVDEGRHVVGVVSQRDLLRNALAAASDLPLSTQRDVFRGVKVRDIMTTDVEMVDADQDIGVAAQIMLENKYGCLPVVEGTRLEGILTEADFVRYLAKRD